MRWSLCGALALCLWACGPADEPCVDEASCGSSLAESHAQALVTDPWENVFAVRRSGTSSYAANPIGEAGITCPDGVRRSECVVSRLNFGQAGLSGTRVQTLLSRIASEPTAEGSASVLLKGLLVRVRDHRTDPPLTYNELRVSAAYLAPAIRPHGATLRYVETGIVDGFQLTKGVNVDLLTRTLNPSVYTRLRWVGPSAERPSSYPVDTFVAYGTWRYLGEPSLFGPVELDVDQRFARVLP